MGDLAQFQLGLRRQPSNISSDCVPAHRSLRITRPHLTGKMQPSGPNTREIGPWTQEHPAWRASLSRAASVGGSVEWRCTADAMPHTHPVGAGEEWILRSPVEWCRRVVKHSLRAWSKNIVSSIVIVATLVALAAAACDKSKQGSTATPPEKNAPAQETPTNPAPPAPAPTGPIAPKASCMQSTSARRPPAPCSSPISYRQRPSSRPSGKSSVRARSTCTAAQSWPLRERSQRSNRPAGTCGSSRQRWPDPRSP